MTECLFCREIEEDSNNIFWRDAGGLFVARWDNFPVTPGHAEIIPTEHVASLDNLSPERVFGLTSTVIKVADIISKTNLIDIYESINQGPLNDKATNFIDVALEKAKKFNRPPDAFNHGINDGEAAGRTVHHLHYHLMPRWTGDMEDPSGGIRHMFPEGGNYRTD